MALHSRDGVIEQSEIGGEFTIILLAAGPSFRMGQSKQTLSISGEPLLVRTAKVAIQANIGKVITVLGSNEQIHRDLIKEMPVEIIFNTRWQTGIGSSLKAGISHLISNYSKTEAAIVMVCDQPLLQPHHIQSLVKKYLMTGAPVVASAYSNTTGVPSLFNRQLFDELLKLRDDQGAKKVIYQHGAVTIDFPEGAVDLDTREDYQNFLQQQSKKMP